jgi:ribosomal-protein-alanine N-acetyltransferase
MISFEPLSTERLILRPPVATDATALYRVASSAEVTKYLSWPRHTSLQNTHDFLRFADAEWDRWPAGPLVLVSRNGGALLGATGLSFETAYRASTGYVLAQEAWGTGLATEALRAIAALSDRLGVRRLYAHCHIEHVASVHVLEHVGFACEGILRKFHVFPNLDSDQPQDVFSYSRTR